MQMDGGDANDLPVLLDHRIPIRNIAALLSNRLRSPHTVQDLFRGIGTISPTAPPGDGFTLLTGALAIHIAVT